MMWRAVVVVVAGIVASPVSPPQQAADFYQGKTLRIMVGATAGGGFDAEARLFARHLPRHLPGSPRVVVEPTPGAGGLVAASLLAKSVKPDGLTVGFFTLAPIMAQLLKNDVARFDVRRFEFVGAPYPDHNVCVLSTSSGVTSLDAWRRSPRPLKLGATVPDSIMAVMPSLIRVALGLPLTVITGYRGATEVRLAMASGEIDGACLGWGGVQNGWPSRSAVTIVLQSGPGAHPAIPDVPLIPALAATAEARDLIGRPLDAMGVVGRFYALPPGTPSERRDLLRRAFLDTATDPAAIRDAEAAGIQLAPVTGQALAAHVDALLTLPPAIAARIRQAVGR